jgi:hypothetical protein
MPSLSKMQRPCWAAGSMTMLRNVLGKVKPKNQAG